MALAAILLGLRATPIAAAALDLADPTPRWIEVRFEVSPSSEPGRLDSTWSLPRAAHLSSRPDEHRVEIRIPASEVEAQLRSTGTDVVVGTFSDFVWTLDPATGHVAAAALTGRVRERVPLGLFSTHVEVAIRVEMTTRTDAGFRSTRSPIGIEIHDYCAPTGSNDGCTVVPARPLDPARGYVNAVGRLFAAAALTEVQAFSPLGEVRFSERPLDVVDGPAPSAESRSGT